jgi:hypothetical protein
MTDRFPLISNPTSNQIEELASGDNLNLQNSGIVGATTITATKFVGTLQGNATSADTLNDAKNITGGFISSDRLSGTYGINVNSADRLNDAANITFGYIQDGRLNGTYTIDINGNATSANTLNDAANITAGIISPDRLDGTYNIRVSSAATASNLTSGLYAVDISGNAGTATTATNLSGGNVTGTSLNISGISTLASSGGITTTGGDLYIGGDLYANKTATIGYSTITNAYIGVATVGFLTATDINVSGTSTVGFLTASDIFTPNATIGILTATTLSNIVNAGIKTISADYITAIGIDFVNYINTGIASVGIATIGFASVTNAYIGIATIDQINITSGIASVGIATIGFASVTNAYIGIITTGQIDINTGILTVTTFSGNLVGIASTATTALGFSTSASINTTGIITATGGFVGGLTGTASTATTALGLSTTASINTSGIITATGGFVGGLTGTASTATNVIGGIASVTQLRVGPGITTVGFITASSLRVSGITTLGITTATNIHVSGVSTFVGESYFSNSIGIGTTNLQVELTVIGSARVGTAATYISIGGNNGRNIEIGVGTTTLDTYIDFGGSSTYTNYSARIFRGSGDDGAFSIINRGGSLRLTTQDASPILFVTSNTPRHRITGDGIFLIGTDASTAERQVLQVAGINSSVYIGGSVGIGTTISTAKLHIGAATTSAAGGAPLKIGAGTTILATPEVGAIEYDGSYLYQTPNSTSGRAYVPPVYSFRLTANGANIGTTIADFFATPSSLSLEASSVYKITCFAYFTKTTAGTAIWTHTFSSAPTIFTSSLTYSPVTGIANGTQTNVLSYSGGQATASMAHAATASLTTGVNHFSRFELIAVTNAATNWRLRLTQSAGTATPLAGSFYTIEKVCPSTGTFVA